MTSTKDDCNDFAEIKNSIERQVRERTYEFNLMLVGTRKIGKSTLVRSLTQGNMELKEVDKARLNEYTKTWSENGVRLKLHCIETSRFNHHDIPKYVDYIEEQFKSHFKKQIRLSPWNIQDTLVHCCIFMIPPDNELVLSEEDIKCMLALHEKVNLVPVIANADKFNASELANFKENVMNDLQKHGIKCFEFQPDIKEDEERFHYVKVEAERFPFAVIATSKSVIKDHKDRWIRELCNGPVDIWDKEKSDFPSLAKLLLRHCTLDLIDTTHTKHYAEFQKSILEAARRSSGKNLVALDLKPHEIKRILYEVRPNYIDPDHLGVRKERDEMEAELTMLNRRMENFLKRVELNETDLLCRY